MLQLTNRTEYSFHTAFGKLSDILANQSEYAGITDRDGTWGHVSWAKECKERNIKPLFGVELAVVDDADEGGRFRPSINYIRLLAKSKKGLRDLYWATSVATEKFHYHPRIDWNILSEVKDCWVLSNCGHNLNKLKELNIIIEANPLTDHELLKQALDMGIEAVATSDNYYVNTEQRTAYQITTNKTFTIDRPQPMHILCYDEWARLFKGYEYLINKQKEIAETCLHELPKAKLLKPKRKKSLRELCIDGAIIKNIDLNDTQYKERLDYELNIIEKKDFEDYFHIVSDLCKYAKKHMMVGAARGSAAGSLVCYLVDITEVDPLRFNLLFERFIDLNREDLPDIDIDFADDKRYMVFDYLKKTYGGDNISPIGAVSRYQSKSTLQDVAKALKIPPWKTADVKGAIIHRSGGDARKAMDMEAIFTELDIGKEILREYPTLQICTKIEGTASHTTKHASGILLTDKEIYNYCAIDHRRDTAMVNKKDAEFLNLLKVDILGLKTLSVIGDTLQKINKDKNWLFNYNLEDKKAFKVINDKKFAGVFQFTGLALKKCCDRMKVENFDDISSITALARPGTLVSGGTDTFIRRRIGDDTNIKYFHEIEKASSESTYGVIVYQEQVMEIGRKLGMMSWETVSELRKAMSKSLGIEFFDQYWLEFRKGALKNGMNEKDARGIWDRMNTMGSWAFNKSHSVSYGLVSYWCMILKAYYPLEFASATLSHCKDDDESVSLLRELTNEGYKYKPYDKIKSMKGWVIEGDTLIGGLIGIKGIADKTADSIIKKREKGEVLTPRQNQLLETGETAYDTLYPVKTHWGHITKTPKIYKIGSELITIKEFKERERSNIPIVIIGRLDKKNVRDLNEPIFLDRRIKSGGGIITENKNFLLMTVTDDTGEISAFVDRINYHIDEDGSGGIGNKIVQEGKLGDYYLWKGVKNWSRFKASGDSNTRIIIHTAVKITNNDFYKPKLD